jgi:hypothetical protein
MSTSDGSTADYYELPAGATELQDLISHRNLNAQDGEIFRAIYRKGRASHSDELRDARKVLFYAQAEVKRLEKLAATPTAFGQQNMIDPAYVEIASAIEDDSERMQAIGQNGNDGEHYDHERIPSFANCKIKSRTSTTEHFARLDSDGIYWSSRGLMFNMKYWQLLRRIK